MKVLDLHCPKNHLFEGWFASESDFQNQMQQGLLQCPMCGDAQIGKRLSAPRLNLGGLEAIAPAQASEVAQVATAPASAGALSSAQQAVWLTLARKIIANTEDVGAQFAREARLIHHGEAPERAIRGEATPDEAAKLIEEGIAVLPLDLPVAAKETLQ